MYKGSLVTIDDLTNEEIEDVLDLAQEMQKDLRGFPALASGHIMASLFFEPSTRTRGSFESAMKRLGGNTITTSDIRSSSMEKGESLADTVRVWSSYSDLMVIRHPWEGAARLAADFSSVPIINGGDGSHEHPTQTLCDLYTLKMEHGSLDGLRIVLCGDLKNGRTVHSLTFALLRFGAQIIFLPGEGLELPDHVKYKIETEYKTPIQKVGAGDLGALYNTGSDGETFNETDIDAVYMTPSRSHQLTMYQPEMATQLDLKGQNLTFYVTRRQAERDENGIIHGNKSDKYPRISKRALSRRFRRSMVLHPLPRVDELSPDMDSDRRSKYFIQAGYGVPVRMALLSLMTGLKPWRKGITKNSIDSKTDQISVMPRGIRCENPSCVINKEAHNCDPELRLLVKPEIRFSCKYCEQVIVPKFYGTEQGGRKTYNPISRLPFKSRHQLFQFYFFRSKEEATEQGFSRSSTSSRDNPRILEVQN